MSLTFAEPRRSMMGTSARYRALETCPARYAIGSEPALAVERARDTCPSMVKPPMCVLRSRNCAGVMVPAFSAASPYWIPTLSTGEPADWTASAPDGLLVVLYVAADSARVGRRVVHPRVIRRQPAVGRQRRVADADERHLPVRADARGRVYLPEEGGRRRPERRLRGLLPRD